MHAYSYEKFVLVNFNLNLDGIFKELYGQSASKLSDSLFNSYLVDASR